VIAVHTLSKIVAPGLRVGWVQAPAPVIARMIDAKQGLDTCPNVPAQRMLAGFMKAGLLDAQVDWIRGLDRARRDAMENALRRSAAAIPAALTLVERGLCSMENKKRYAELMAARAARLGF
jgi:2-aminoadipate transaminase